MLWLVAFAALFLALLFLWRSIFGTDSILLSVFRLGVTAALEKRWTEKKNPSTFRFKLGQEIIGVTDEAMMQQMLQNKDDHFSAFADAVLPLVERLFAIPANVVKGEYAEGTQMASHSVRQPQQVDQMFRRAVQCTLPFVRDEMRQGGIIEAASTMRRLAFDATVLGVFGEAAAAEKQLLFEAFEAHDSKGHLLAAGLPWKFFPRMSRLYYAAGALLRDTAYEAPTAAVRDRAAAMKGLPDDIQGHFAYSFLFATAANTCGASAWIVMHLAENQTLQNELLSEITQILGAQNVSKLRQLLARDFSRENFEKSEEFEEILRLISRETVNQSALLEGCFKEVMRIYWDGFYVRSTKQNTQLTDSNGEIYSFEKDVLIYGLPMLYHHNEKKFKNPLRFEPKRWIEGPEKNNPVITFGGGKSACPGRLFAQSEVKMFVVCVLLQYELRALDSLPKVSPDKGGFGLSLPNGKMRVECIPRK